MHLQVFLCEVTYIAKTFSEMGRRLLGVLFMFPTRNLKIGTWRKEEKSIHVFIFAFVHKASAFLSASLAVMSVFNAWFTLSSPPFELFVCWSGCTNLLTTVTRLLLKSLLLKCVVVWTHRNVVVFNILLRLRSVLELRQWELFFRWPVSAQKGQVSGADTTKRGIERAQVT